jgi:hypothetical protein
MTLVLHTRTLGYSSLIDSRGDGLSGLDGLLAVKKLIRITGQQVPFPAQYTGYYYIVIVQNLHLQKSFNALSGSTLFLMSKIV